MILLAPGPQLGFLLIHTFTLGSWVRCYCLTTFHLNQYVRIIYFWTKQLQILNRAWIQPSLIPLRHQNWTHPLMSLMSLLLQSLHGFSAWSVLILIFLNCSLLLDYDLINYGARQVCFFSPMSLVNMMSASKLIKYFSSHPPAFGLWSSTQTDNITLNLVNRKVNQSLSEFQTAIGAAAHVPLNRQPAHFSYQCCTC